tara:strand:- start:855 stop:1103 length:249 start_codon:yes stop_codon:yes gene_type:complete
MEKVDEEQENIVDFIEYKLMKMLDSFSVGSSDYEAILTVLGLYLDGKVNVKWANDDVMVMLKENADIDLDDVFPETDSPAEE